eukprot:gnl/Hemi2/24941_TR8396_c0_g1_i1.p1 gnl/Hemi2/24941_TR8396_c0_g1~~gnl/Hemi2/24941_TR8396_c0_g1_i1.p1  ORF type:complete len:186 (+),score=17.89 gnl/Hemi2/24941_TR8396_c0_g1_i1:115-672(+)
MPRARKATAGKTKKASVACDTTSSLAEVKTEALIPSFPSPLRKANPHTLKHKKAVRSLINAVEQSYCDDIFQSSPVLVRVADRLTAPITPLVGEEGTPRLLRKLNRDHMDLYVSRIKNRTKTKPTVLFQKTKKISGGNAKILKPSAIHKVFRDIQGAKRELADSDDEEAEYYWSEDEENQSPNKI